MVVVTTGAGPSASSERPGLIAVRNVSTRWQWRLIWVQVSVVLCWSEQALFSAANVMAMRVITSHSVLSVLNVNLLIKI